jgi:capsular exopolysaccharide synthesis family protein
MVSVNGSQAVTDEELEAFRILRTNADFLSKDRDLKTVAVTSPLAEEGKSTVAAGFAYANALAGRRTLLIECDFRRPVLAERYGLDSTPGLSEYLVGEASPREVLRSIDVEGPIAESLPVIPAGERGTLPAEMIASRRFEEFLTQVAKAYELVVLDSPPLLAVGDTLELVPQVDGVLLCIRLGQTTRDGAQQAKEAISRLPERPVGLVATGVPRGGEDDYIGTYAAYSGAGGSA